MQIIEPGRPSQSSEKGATSQREPQGRGRVQPGCATSKDCGKTESRASLADASFRQMAPRLGKRRGLWGPDLGDQRGTLPGSSLALGPGLVNLFCEGKILLLCGPDGRSLRRTH